MSRRNPGAESAKRVRPARERLAVTLGGPGNTTGAGRSRASRHAADSRAAGQDAGRSPALLEVQVSSAFDGHVPAGSVNGGNLHSGHGPAGTGREAGSPGTARLRARVGLRAAVLLGVVAVILGCCYWWQAGSGGARVEPLSETAPAAEEDIADASVGSASPSGDDSGAGPARITVHVAGAVATPGVIQLPAGSRLHEAISAAGGATATADPDRLNLAAVLEDGQKVFVPARGEPDQAGGPDAGTGPSGSGTGGAGQGGDGRKINLNTASLEELGTLPRVGPVLAQRIVDWRRQHGRFKTAQELDAVEGIGPKLLEALLPLVSV